MRAQSGSEDSVVGSRSPTALYVSEYRYFAVSIGIDCLETFGNIVGMTFFFTLSNYKNAKLFFTRFGFVQFYHIGKFIATLWDENSFCTTGNTGMQCDVAGMSAHDFNKKHTVMSICCIANFIDGLHGCIDGGIVADGGVCTPKIIINGSGAAYTG